ncbi:MAG: hypothetical protein QM733_09410 [Ilumatobacteraceae bacterium]
MSCTRRHSLHRSHPPSPPVRSATDALEVIALAMTRPPRAETLAFVVDDDGRASALYVVEGTERADALIDVVHLLAEAAASGEGTGLVVASVRPTVPIDVDPADLDDADIDRWLEASDIAADRGIELLEWFVVGPVGIHCPRELFGEPPRWPWIP